MATIKLSKQQWEFIGKKAGWMKTAVINDDGYADGGEPYTDEEMDLMFKQKVDTIKNSDDRVQKWKDLIDLYCETHPFASGYELNTLEKDLGPMPLIEINSYIDKFVYAWQK